MGSQIIPSCDFVFGFMRCDMPEDARDIDLRICMIRGIHAYKEDRDSHINKFRPWGSYVTPFASLKRKITNFIRCREAATTHSCSYPSQQPQDVIVEEKESTLINITKSTIDNKWLPRCISVQPVPQPCPGPKSKPRIWLGTKMLKNKAAKSEPIPDGDYCTICTPSDKICPAQCINSLQT